MKKTVPQNAVLIPDNAKRVFHGEVFSVYQWPQKMFDGKTKTFEMIKRVDTVKAICVVDNKLIIIHEQQPTFNYDYELPGGRVEPIATSLLAEIKREVKEETGYEFRNWRLIHVRQVSIKIEGFFFYFLATNPTKIGKPKLDHGEKIEVKLMDFEEVAKIATMPDSSLSNEWPIFHDLDSLDNLLKKQTFQGKVVDR